MPGVIDDPNLYVIYVTRDPRDVIVSRHGKSEDMYYSNIRLWRELHACARSLFGHDRFLNIRYEDFVNNPDATQSQITAKFPWLEKQHKFSEYHEHAQVSEKSKVAMRGVRPI
ncbi:sulfotransferase, partial [Gammaproteobacteria bacterium]|nr:sulfotransferase [Gammaproteobacteria bacterium]